MKVLIIGSKGFIGAALSAYLAQRGHDIVEADIVHEYGNPNYVQLDPNASDYEFESLFKEHNFNACVNCSGAAVVSESFTNTLHDYRLNTVNVYRILNAIRTNSPECKFINISSAAVYGNPRELPVKETHSVSPLSPYGFHKWQSEQICEYFSDIFSLNCVALRVFSAFGPGLRKQLFWDLYQKYLNSNGEIVLFGTGEETRDFIYIEDICRIIEKVIMSTSLVGFNVYNVGSGVESKIADVAKEFFSQLGFEGNITFTQELLPGYPTRWLADISLLKTFGINNFRSLEDGITEYLEWIKNT